MVPGKVDAAFLKYGAAKSKHSQYCLYQQRCEMRLISPCLGSAALCAGLTHRVLLLPGRTCTAKTANSGRMARQT
eukprot:3001809-Rhodomonas_salina.1